MTEIIMSLLPYGATVVAVLGGLLYVFMRGRSDAEQDIKADERETIDKAREIQNEIDSEDDAAVRDRAAAWVRGDKR